MAHKFGEGHLSAMARLGLKELRNALNPSRESVADNEIGLYGSATQGEIAEARGGPGRGPEQEASSGTLSLDDLREQAKQLAQSEGRSKDRSKEQNVERDRGSFER